MDYMDLFRILPKTNCSECRQATCLSFAKQAAVGRLAFTACPYIAVSCDSCGKTQEMPFRKCPACGISVEDKRKEMDSRAIVCPKCGYEQDNSFSECPECGVTVAAFVRMARKTGKTGGEDPAATSGAPQAQAASAAKTPKDPKPPLKTREITSYQCPYCGFVTTYTLPDCPGCGYTGGPGFDKK